jgi:hypothetical protein
MPSARSRGARPIRLRCASFSGSCRRRLRRSFDRFAPAKLGRLGKRTKRHFRGCYSVSLRRAWSRGRQSALTRRRWRRTRHYAHGATRYTAIVGGFAALGDERVVARRCQRSGFHHRLLTLAFGFVRAHLLRCARTCLVTIESSMSLSWPIGSYWRRTAFRQAFPLQNDMGFRLRSGGPPSLRRRTSLKVLRATRPGSGSISSTSPPARRPRRTTLPR